MGERKYLLDEHVTPNLRRAIHQHNSEIVVWCVGEPGAPPRQTGDADILLWCEKQGYTLVTNNRATMPVHLRNHLEMGRHMPGILILNDDMSIGETAEQLAIIHGAAEPKEYADIIIFLPIPW